MKLWHALFLALCVLIAADSLVGNKHNAARLQETGEGVAHVVAKAGEQGKGGKTESRGKASFAAMPGESDMEAGSGPAFVREADLAQAEAPADRFSLDGTARAAVGSAPGILTTAGSRVQSPRPELIEG